MGPQPALDFGKAGLEDLPLPDNLLTTLVCHCCQVDDF
jgi:hypothetical protein